MTMPFDRASRRRSFVVLALGVASVAFVAFVATTLLGCGRAEPTPSREDKLVVFAATSLREAFTSMGKEFSRQHPGVELSFNFAGTQELRTQVEQGASGDVFASADPHHMNELLRASHVGAPTVFARNEPVVVVAREFAPSLRTFVDLPNAERIVIGAPEVPIGRYTLQILDRAVLSLGSEFRARVEAKVASREMNVRQVLTKVTLGEAQAGFVYRTDALAARERVTIVAIPPELNVLAEYPIAVVTGAPHPRLAHAWIDFVLSPEGRRALTDAGFGTPDSGAVP